MRVCGKSPNLSFFDVGQISFCKRLLSIFTICYMNGWVGFLDDQANGLPIILLIQGPENLVLLWIPACPASFILLSPSLLPSKERAERERVNINQPFFTNL